MVGAPEDVLVLREWEVVRLAINAAACLKQGGAYYLVVAVSWPAVVRGEGVRAGEIVVAEKCQTKHMVPDFSRKASEQRALRLKVGVSV